jgi:hypothetical protein
MNEGTTGAHEPKGDFAILSSTQFFIFILSALA